MDANANRRLCEYEVEVCICKRRVEPLDFVKEGRVMLDWIHKLQAGEQIMQPSASTPAASSYTTPGGPLKPCTASTRIWVCMASKQLHVRIVSSSELQYLANGLHPHACPVCLGKSSLEGLTMLVLNANFTQVST